MLCNLYSCETALKNFNQHLVIHMFFSHLLSFEYRSNSQLLTSAIAQELRLRVEVKVFKPMLANVPGITESPKTFH